MAIADLRQAIRLEPKDPAAYLHLAWILGTSTKSSLRNGKEAVTLATKACELLEWKDADALNILAAAYAETGDFEQAIKWVTKYIESPGATVESRKIATARRALYQARQPYREER